MSRVAALNALHEILNRRNVEWWEDHDDGEVFTYWKSPIFGIVSAIENEDGETLFMACLNNCDFTPEQAIAATLDSGELTTEQMRDDSAKKLEEDVIGRATLSYYGDGTIRLDSSYMGRASLADVFD